MNKLYCLILMLVACQICQAQSPNWQWAKGASGNNDDSGNSISVDAIGNSYVTGYFKSATINFGGSTLTNSSAFSDIFIIKYDAFGNVLWARSAGGVDDDQGTGIVIDQSDNLYVIGNFKSASITFGATTLINQAVGYNDIFIVKYDTSGNVIWAESSGGSNNEYGTSITSDIIGNVFITGAFSSPSIIFGNDTLTNTTVPYGDLFFVKYNSLGTVIWTKSAGGSIWEEGYSITTDADGSSYLCGDFNSPAMYIGGTTLLNASGNVYDDIFIAKYDSTGNLQWAKTVGGTHMDLGYGIKADANKNIYLAGSFYSPSITFGAFTLSNPGSPNYGDTYIAKYDSSGNVLWAESAGGSAGDYTISLTVDTNCNAYVTGWFFSSSLIFGSTTLNNSGHGDIFIAKYDSSGSVIWAKGVGGTSGWDGGTAIAIEPAGNLYLTGYFYSNSISFDNTTLTNINGSSSSDVFVAKLGNITGYEETSNYYELVTVFPNPVLNVIKVAIRDNKPSSIILYDIASRRLLQQSFTSSISLNTEQLAKGIYLYEVRNKNGVIKKGKIVKE